MTSGDSVFTPQPTRYNGILYKSATEARWAAFFDLIGYEVEYEPEIFPDVDGSPRTPDLFVPEFNMLIEVKGKNLTGQYRLDEYRRLEEIAKRRGWNVGLAEGWPADDNLMVKIVGEKDFQKFPISNFGATADVCASAVCSYFRSSITTIDDQYDHGNGSQPDPASDADDIIWYKPFKKVSPYLRSRRKKDGNPSIALCFPDDIGNRIIEKYGKKIDVGIIGKKLFIKKGSLTMHHGKNTFCVYLNSWESLIQKTWGIPVRVFFDFAEKGDFFILEPLDKDQR